MAKTFFSSQLNKTAEHMVTFEKLQLVKEMITLLVVCWTIIISKIIIK